MVKVSVMLLSVVLLVVLYTEVTTGIIHSKEKNDEMVKKYNEWYDEKNIHRCKYQQEDFDYFKSLCSKTSKVAFTPKAITGRRKEYRCMSRSERNGYHSALQSMKNTRVGAQNEFDNLVVLHDQRTAPSSHFSPGFCLWHRIYLHIWERAIKKYCGGCFIPYWDSRLESNLGGNPQNSVIFSPALAGNANGPVTTGFAADWTISGQCARSTGGILTRDFDRNTGSLYTNRDVRSARRTTSYYQLFFPWSQTFEWDHGFIHMAFGQRSQMSNVFCSPFDPMFLSHHAFVEKMCEEIRVNIRGAPYPDVRRIRGNDMNGNVAASRGDLPVRPFNFGSMRITHRDALLEDELDPTWYTYERSPADVTCNQSSDCCVGGITDFIFCHRSRCVSKAQEGARIRPSFPDEACYCESGTPRNNGGTCECNR